MIVITVPWYGLLSYVHTPRTYIAFLLVTLLAAMAHIRHITCKMLVWPGCNKHRNASFAGQTSNKEVKCKAELATLEGQLLKPSVKCN
jgi:hypothetical protein